MEITGHCSSLLDRLAGNLGSVAANLAVGKALVEPLLPLLDDRV
jgi:hypothetical protein